MQPIHIDPDQMYSTARIFWQQHLDMVDQIYFLKTSLYRLEMAWQGGTADEFHAEIQVLLQNLNSHAEELLSMGLTLSRQGEMWDESDQRWAWNYRNIVR